MTSGGGALAGGARVLHRISSRAISSSSNSFHVGPNVKLRRCESQPLENVNITVLHNGPRAKVISNLLSARGATLTHFIKEGAKVPDVEGQGVFVNLDCRDSKSELLASLKRADVFVDTSTKGLGVEPKEVVKHNARLIYATVQEDATSFSSMRALAWIASALYAREKTSIGQVITLTDSAEAIRRMDAQQNDV